MPWPSDPPTHPRPANLRSTGEESLLGCWRGGRGLRVNGAAGGPGCCSRTGRDAPQIDPRQRSLRTESLTGRAGVRLQAPRLLGLIPES